MNYYFFLKKKVFATKTILSLAESFLCSVKQWCFVELDWQIIEPQKDKRVKKKTNA